MTDKERLQLIKEKQRKHKDGLSWIISFSDVEWLIEQVEILQKLKENIIDTMRFAEKEMSMYDNDYVRGIYHAYKDILAEIERLEAKK